MGIFWVGFLGLIAFFESFFITNGEKEWFLTEAQDTKGDFEVYSKWLIFLPRMREYLYLLIRTIFHSILLMHPLTQYSFIPKIRQFLNSRIRGFI